MTLTEDIRQAQTEQTTREKERREHERNRSLEQAREAVVYTLGQEPDNVEWDSKFGGVATVEDVQLALTYRSSTPTLAVVCVCANCGQKFLSAETFGSNKNHYGPSAETLHEKRRKNAVEQIAKVMARGCQPNGYGHDHKCVALVSRMIPVDLVDQVDTLLANQRNYWKETNG